VTGWRLSTPVAFIVFNRPETTATVFAEIARAKPPKLLLIADGPRPDRPGEAERCAAARAVVDGVDWDCEVLTDLSAVHLGCKRRVSSGLDWVFAQVPEAIVIEDDCLPHPTFFRFCEELLARYREDWRVSQIGGVNFQDGFRPDRDSYYFSKLTHCWGWASWRDRWQSFYDVGMAHWPAIRDAGRAGELVGSAAEAPEWAAIFDRVHAGELDTWDYQWVFACMRQASRSVLPAVNLVSNIGFGADATHTLGHSRLAAVPVEEMPFPLRHPEALFARSALDERFFRRHMAESLPRRLCGALLRAIRME
jgi:hypothetical protein